MYFRLEEGNFQPAMLVYLGTKKQLPLPTRQLHLGPLLSTRESIVVSSHGCFKFKSDIYNPFLSNQSEPNHSKYIHSFWNALPNEKPTPLWPPVFPSPKKRRRDPGGLSSLFTRGDGAEVPLVGLRNDACGTSRRPVDGGEDRPSQETHWCFFSRKKKKQGVIGLIDIVIVMAPSSNSFFYRTKIGCVFFMRPVFSVVFIYQMVCIEVLSYMVGVALEVEVLNRR